MQGLHDWVHYRHDNSVHDEEFSLTVHETVKKLVVERCSHGAVDDVVTQGRADQFLLEAE